MVELLNIDEASTRLFIDHICYKLFNTTPTFEAIDVRHEICHELMYFISGATVIYIVLKLIITNMNFFVYMSRTYKVDNCHVQ